MQEVPETGAGETVWGPAALESRRNETERLLTSIAPVREKWIDRNRYYYGRIRRLLRFLVEPRKSVLSIRCGLGHQLAELDPSLGVGVDISPEITSIGRNRYPDLKFITAFPDGADFESQFSPGSRFGYIIFNAIDDTPDVQAALRNLAKVADTQTRLIILTYNHLWEPLIAMAERFGLKVPAADQNWLSEGDIVNFLEVTGFEWLKTFRITLFPKYIPLVSEFLNDFCARLPGLNKLCMVQALVARRAPEPISMEKLKVSIVVPCKDERGNVESAVNRVPSLGCATELIFCDDKSTDGTADEVLRMQELHPHKDIRLIPGPGICKAQNVWTGFEAATGDVLMILDADLTTMPEELPYFLELLASGRAEFVNGSRLVYPMPRAAMKPANMLGNKFFGVAFSYLLGQRVKDTLCGTKVLWRRDWERMKPLLGSWGTSDRWGDYELLFGAAKLNLRIRDLPVHYQERLYGSTKMTKVFQNGLVMLRMCFFGFLKLKLGY